MLIEFCKSKIAHATITEAELRYEGSITVDKDLLDVVDIVPGEKVAVLNMNNGARIETYAIAGKAGSGRICLNGAAARTGLVGDEIIILSYGLVKQSEAKDYTTKIVYLDENNRIKKEIDSLIFKNENP